MADISVDWTTVIVALLGSGIIQILRDWNADRKSANVMIATLHEDITTQMALISHTVQSITNAKIHHPFAFIRFQTGLYSDFLSSPLVDRKLRTRIGGHIHRYLVQADHVNAIMDRVESLYPYVAGGPIKPERFPTVISYMNALHDNVTDELKTALEQLQEAIQSA